MSEYDAIIIGGGPAGSTAGALLAEKGRKVLILEKEKFPRYHVGESLMPFCYFTFERLGLVDALNERAYTKKHSVQFVTRDGKMSAPFYFFQHLDHPAATTWQVNRAEFDELMLDNARAKGAEVREETQVVDFIYEGERVVGVTAKTKGGQAYELRASVTVDASGRDALFQSKRRWRKRDPILNKIAIWTLFKGAKRDPGLDEGATTVAYLDDRGWFWNIPMKDDIVSSGIVAERDYLYKDTRDPAAIFKREIENNVWIKDHLSCGEQFGEYWVTGEYSYRSEHCAADGIVLIGDAFAFLDPVFSSGVFLALKSGEMAADAIDASLEKGNVSASAFSAYGEEMCSAIETMRSLVYAFYDNDFSFGKLIRKNENLRGRLTDCLIGDLVDKDFEPLMKAIGEIAKLPERLKYGRANMG
ncbi:MAG: NAD(P)/FAD-dependent oxidoreductase [Opitutaceae bacterium]|nr:NAD(P)/FAD-dependent oxidoreductase [Opitutaceae bacterium]